MQQDNMQDNTNVVAKPASGKYAFYIGWFITILLGALLLVGAMANVLRLEAVVKATEDAGMPTGPIRVIGVALLVSVICYLVPQTAVLGAVLLTGYFGGACATHVIREDPAGQVIFPVILGAIIWLGIYLREPRLRAIMPWRCKAGLK